MSKIHASFVSSQQNAECTKCKHRWHCSVVELRSGVTVNAEHCPRCDCEEIHRIFPAFRTAKIVRPSPQGPPRFESSPEEFLGEFPAHLRILCEVQHGPGEGHTYELTQSRTTFGRGQEDIGFNDLSISHGHLVLMVQHTGAVILRDLASTNGTLVNGEPVFQALLNDGDRITLGETEFVLRITARE